jgi:uncharacterized membrane protein
LKYYAMGAAALLGALFVMAPEPASARFAPQSVTAPILTENVACTTRRVRTVRPNRIVVVRNVQS